MDDWWFLGPVHPGASFDERSAAAAMRRALSAAISTGVEGKGARRAWQVPTLWQRVDVYPLHKYTNLCVDPFQAPPETSHFPSRPTQNRTNMQLDWTIKLADSHLPMNFPSLQRRKRASVDALARANAPKASLAGLCSDAFQTFPMKAERKKSGWSAVHSHIPKDCQRNAADKRLIPTDI